MNQYQNTEKRIVKRLMALTLALMLALVVFAFTLTETKAAGIGTPALVKSTGTLNGTQVYFGSWEGNPVKWHVVDADIVNNNVTLWTTTSIKSGRYARFDNDSWNNAEICFWLNGPMRADETADFLGKAFSASEREAMVPEYGVPDEIYANGNKTIDSRQTIVLPSVAEMGAGTSTGTWQINQTARAGVGRNYWLRTPGSDSFLAAYVNTLGVVEEVGFHVDTNYFNVLPAFKLNMESVVLTSAANGTNGKAAANINNGFVAATPPSGAVKLTLQSASQTLNLYATTAQSTQTVPTTGALSFNFSNATAGKYAHFVSCVLEQNGAVKYYAKLSSCYSKASGALSIPLSGVTDGTYTLKIFSEEANGDNLTDFCSAPITMTLNIGSGTGTVSAFTGTVQNTPIFTAHPQDVIKNHGEPASFSVQVVPGNPAAYTLRWQLLDGGVWTDIPGETGTTLTLTDVAAGSSGSKYRCAATNASGTSFSNAATLTVNEVQVSSISLDQTAKTLITGESFTLASTVLPTNATYKDVEWRSDNESVATVDYSGKVTAVGQGNATITVYALNGAWSADGLTDQLYHATCAVTVPAPSYTLSVVNGTGGGSFHAGATANIVASPAPYGQAFDHWTSDNGGVFANAYSSSTVFTVPAANVTVTALYKAANITPPPPPKVDPISNGIIKGDGGVPGGKVEVKFPDGTAKTATADANGNWSINISAASSVSNITITRYSLDGTPLGSPVKINTTVKAASIKTMPSVYIVAGKSMTLPAAVQPFNATNKGYSWRSPSSSIVKVNSATTGKITAGAKAAGKKVKLKVTSKDGSKVAYCTVYVVKKAVAIKGVSITQTGTLGLLRGKTLQIKPVNNPKNATGIMPTFKSSNTRVAVIDKAGVITALSKGKATITVVAGKYRKNFALQIGNVAPTKLTLNKSVYSLAKGKSYKLTAKSWTPSNTDLKLLTWTTNNKKAVTVSGNGVIKGVAKGKATITAKTWNGKIAKCVVSVK